jgi:hypothetical protein
MIKPIWSVLCEGTSIDSETNKVSIFNTLDGLTIFGDPEQETGVPIRFEVISFWERSEEDPCEGKMRVYQRKPSGKKSDYFPFYIDLTKSHFHQTRIKFNGMPLSGPGRYAFVVEYKEGEGKWKKAAELPILINFEMKE